MTQVACDLVDVCLRTDTELSRIAGCLYPFTNRNLNCGALEALNASEALSDGEVIPVNDLSCKAKPKMGEAACELRKVRVFYEQPDCDYTTMDQGPLNCGVNLCGPTENPISDEELSECVTVDKVISHGFDVDPCDFTCSCSDLNTVLAKNLFKTYKKFKVTKNKAVLEAFYAGVGNCYLSPEQIAAGEAPVSTLTKPKELKILTDCGGCELKPQPIGLQALENEYSKQSPNCAETPILLGGGAGYWKTFLNSQALFQGNVDGKDISKFPFNANPFYDNSLDICGNDLGIAGTQRLISFLPGAVRPISFNYFDCENYELRADGRTAYGAVRSGGKIIRQVIDLGSAFGDAPFLVDMQIEYDPCPVGGKIYYKFWHHWDIWKIPEAAFQPCGVHNYCLLWDVMCAPYMCADAQNC